MNGVVGVTMLSLSDILPECMMKLRSASKRPGRLARHKGKGSLQGDDVVKAE